MNAGEIHDQKSQIFPSRDYFSLVNPLLFSSFNYLHALFANTKQNAVLLMDREGTITAINEAFSNHFGYAWGDIVNKKINILFTEQDRLNGLPKKELDEVLSTGQSSDNNYLLNKNNAITWVSGESLLVTNSEGGISILKIIQNIHHQKLAEEAIVRLNEFNESILSSIEDAVIVLSDDMQILKANKAFDNLFKQDEIDISSLNFGDVIKPYDVNNELYNSIQTAINTKKGFLNKQIEIETAAREKKIFDVNCGLMEDNYHKNNVLIVIHDITIHKQMEREREDIIGFVAHELRNPLANVVICNELLSDSIQSNKIKEANDLLARSKNNIERLNKMITELYDAARVNSGNLQLDISTLNFEEMIKEAIETVEVLQPSYKIIVTGNGNIKVSGDRYRLIQVVTNYLSNGIKYSNGRTHVVLSMKHDENTVTVSVKDEGLGISKNQLPYIFERFFRAEKTKNLEGIGLGLYLCRQIIHAHKGHVWAESEEGKGSTFYFSIPINSPL
jgi:PAS domain S-box-containing protein